MDNAGIPEHNNQTMTVGEWMITLLISYIPIVNIIMYFVWGFGDNTNQNKANWAKASLIWIAILIGLYILFFVIILGTAGLIEGLSD